jgi:hypothetical protein
MIRVGYETNEGESVIGGEFVGAPDANACMAQLIINNAHRTDIVTYYYDRVFGDEIERIGYVDP